MQNSVVKRLGKILRWGFVLFGAVSISAMSFRYFSGEVIGVLNLQRDWVLESTAYRVAFYVHVLGGIIALLTGPTQFWSKLRTQSLATHRLVGRIYVYSILLSGLAGIPVVLFAHGGWIAVLGFVCLNVLWLSTTLIAIRAAMHRKIAKHKVWMERSYAVTFSAVTLRIIIGLGGVLGFAFTPGYQFSAWACWIINLSLLECYRYQRRRKVVVSRLIPDQ